MRKDKDTTWVEVNIDGDLSKAINYSELTGPVDIGDELILNTTAVELSLGTGGYHFVIFNYSNENSKIEGKGHIMKLRYTPFQLKCLAAEEEDSPYHELFNEFTSLNGSVFIVGTLHSMLAPLASMLKWLKPSLKINYIMTDGGALPIQFSNTVKSLKDKEIINSTITIGNAFGGDIECVNIYSGLIAAKEILNGDVTIITMGPGIAGTGTKYGFSGIEQGYIIDAVNNLGGIPFVAPRISFKDNRERHRGISHHTLTALSTACNTKGKLVIPYLTKDKDNLIREQLINKNLFEKHNIIYEEGSEIIKALDYFNLNVSTMGRDLKEDADYFITLGAVAKSTFLYLDGEEDV